VGFLGKKIVIYIRVTCSFVQFHLIVFGWEEKEREQENLPQCVSVQNMF